jgi:hypothetical protein
MKNRKECSNSGAEGASRSTSGESLPKNKDRHKIDWAYIAHINHLKATGQIPVIRFTATAEIPKRDSGKKRKTPNQTQKE